MANGLFSSRSKSLRDSVADEARTVEDQIADLRAELASLAGLLADDAAGSAKSIRKKARAVKAEAGEAAQDLKDRAQGDIADMIAAGEDILAEFQARYRDTGHKARKAVHERPLTTLGIAAAAGFLLAALLRR